MSENGYAEKINKLLRQAESTEFEEERDAFVEKAQELMTRYSIDEAMLAMQRGESDKGEKPEAIVQESMMFEGMYGKAHISLAFSVARANHCRAYQSTWGASKTWFYWVGFSSDVARVKLLITSLEVQTVGAREAWWKQVSEDYSQFTPARRFSVRREFDLSFGDEVGTRLRAASRKATEAAKVEFAQVSEAKVESMGLALRKRDDAVNDWMDTHVGKLRAGPGHTRRYNAGAREAGRAAGARADLGGTGLGGKRAAIGA